MHLYMDRSRLTMMQRSKEAAGPRRPETPSWLAGAMIGLTIYTLATSAIMLVPTPWMGQVVSRGCK
jgi:hypothetical protein